MRIFKSTANKFTQNLATGTFVLGRTDMAPASEAGITGGAYAVKVTYWPTVSNADANGALVMSVHAATALTGGTVAETPFATYGVLANEVHPIFVDNPGLRYIEVRVFSSFVTGTVSIAEEVYV